MVDLITVLNDYHVDSLREMAQHNQLELPKEPARKAWLVDELNQTILKNAADPAYIDLLDKAERSALGQLLTWKNPVPRSQLELRMIITGSVQNGVRSRRSGLPLAEDVLRSLLLRGFIVDQTPLPANTRRKFLDTHDVLAIASDVQKQLMTHKLPVLHTQPGAGQDSKEPAYKVGTDLKTIIRRLFFVWSDLRREPAKRLKSDAMSKRDLKRMAVQLGLDKDEGIEEVIWLETILRTMKLVSADENQISAVDSSAALLFWNSSTLRQIPNLLTAYTQLQHEITFSTSKITIFSSYGLQTLPENEIRSTVLTTMEQLAGGTWLPFDLVYRYAMPAVPGALSMDTSSLRSISYHQTWTSRQYETRLNQQLRQLDEQAFLAVLEEMSALGLIELGYAAPPQPGQHPESLQLSSWMQAHYLQQAPVLDTTQGQVIVQPDFQVLCMGPLSLGILSSVENCAIREKLDDNVITYRITKESVYAAMQRGESASSINSHLEEVSGQPVPQNIQRSLHEWEGQYHRIVLHKSITILQADSIELMSLLENDAVAGALINRIDDQTVWIHNKDLNAIQQRLFALEHLPSFSENATADIEHSMVWDNDLLHTRHPLPSLFVKAALHRFAKSVDGGRIWQIDQHSLRRAAEQGLAAPDVLTQLALMTGNHVPDIWVKRIKAWTGYFGDAQSAPVRLLRLKQPHKLKELRQAAPQLRQWLHPLPDVDNVVVVETQHWDDVCALLADWGITIDDSGWW